MPTPENRSPLNAEALRRGLVRGLEGGDPTAFWARLEVVQETGSTNADLLARAAANGDPSENDRSVLIAEFQGSGRGRHSRTWVSPPQAQIAMSVLLTLPGMDLRFMGWLPLLAGVATVDAIRSVAQVPAELKWPNDVLIDGRKVAGILAEVAATKPDLVVVLGIGINVSLTADELPVPAATSLTLENAAVADRETLIRAVLGEIAARWQQWFDADWRVTDLAAAYRARCGTIGQRVRALLPGDRELVGVATDVDSQGQLVITADDTAEPVAVSAGDITHLRPAGGDPQV